MAGDKWRETDNSFRSGKLNSKGVTLIEVIIYAVLLVIVSMIIGSQVKTMLKSYTGGQRVSSIQGGSRDVLAMLAREIRNTGFKRTLTPGTSAGTWTINNVAGVTFSDGSSIKPSEGTPGDRLNIRKANINANGDLTGVDDITYALNGTNLQRILGNDTTNLAQNVQALQFQYGLHSENQVLLNQRPVVGASWDTVNCTKSGNMQINVVGNVSGRVTCNTSFSLTRGHVRVSFNVSGADGFPEALSEIKWVLRGNGGNGAVLGSESFLPRSGKNQFDFPVLLENNDARLSLEFTSTGNGKLQVSEVVLTKVSTDRFTWVNMPDSIQRPLVKAVKVFLLTRTSGETDTKRSGSITVANYNCPTVGNYTWRLYEEIIEIPNNGL